MKLLLTNDDGIDAPGLRALVEAVESVGEVYVAAPDRQRSECGHQVTTRSGISVEPWSDRQVAVGGTPADCVRLAVRGGLFGDTRFDWLLSGINEGGNLGVDIYYSGTVAAAREAAILGLPAAAFSHYRRAQHSIDWRLAATHAQRVFSRLQSERPSAKGFWNANFPHGETVPVDCPIVSCEPSRAPMPIAFKGGPLSFQYSGVYADRIQEPDRDVACCFGGQIALSYILL